MDDVSVLWAWVTWGNAALILMAFVAAFLFFRYVFFVTRLDEYADDDNDNDSADEAAGK